MSSANHEQGRGGEFSQWLNPYITYCVSSVKSLLFCKRILSSKNYKGTRNNLLYLMLLLFILISVGELEPVKQNYREPKQVITPYTGLPGTGSPAFLEGAVAGKSYLKTSPGSRSRDLFRGSREPVKKGSDLQHGFLYTHNISYKNNLLLLFVL